MSLLVHRHAVLGGGGVWTPSDLTNGLHFWDLEGTITTSGGDVTQVDDLVGTTDLVSGSHGDPLYVASDSDLGGRKAAQHALASSEALAVSITSESQAFTMWAVFTIDTLSGTPGIMGENGGDIDVFFSTYFAVFAGTTRTGTVTAAAANTAYLLIAVFDGTSSEIYINDVDDNISGSTIGGGALASFIIGADSTSAYADMSWTAAGVTSDAMSTGDRSSLYTWAQDNCGV